MIGLMKNKWTELGIEDWFHHVHHFSSNQFSNSPTSLNAFVNGLGEHIDEVENRQTIARAMQVARFVNYGLTPDEAITAAWRTHPLGTK